MGLFEPRNGYFKDFCDILLETVKEIPGKMTLNKSGST